ncbi:putative carboxylesterase nap [Lachnospiraceae bacterium]|nr:putative carboxylesterase nap [Lachnospiraceae bacterium]
MKKGLNFRTIESQKEYFVAYEKALKLVSVPFNEKYITTSFGDSYVLCAGNEKNPPLVLLHAASCGPLSGIKIYCFGATIFVFMRLI